MSSIYEAITEIVKVQEKMAITAPAHVSIKKVWPFFPPSSTTAAIAVPCWMNEWSLIREDRFSSNWTDEWYTVHMQLLIQDMDLSRAAWIASAFMPVALRAFDSVDGAGDGGVSLGGTAVTQTVRGGTPTLARIERSEGVYMGLDLFMDLNLHGNIAIS